ncbi:MAG: hypothetical protein ACXVCM_15695 [Ktedonobacteraceae bacterium]
MTSNVWLWRDQKRGKGYTTFRRFLIDGAPYGGLLGPVCDIGNFLKAYLNGGTFQGRHLLDPTSIAEMFHPQQNNRGEVISTDSSERTQRIGLGWHLAGDGNSRFCNNLGGGAVFLGEFRMYPSLD